MEIKKLVEDKVPLVKVAKKCIYRKQLQN